MKSFVSFLLVFRGTIGVEAFVPFSASGGTTKLQRRLPNTHDRTVVILSLEQDDNTDFASALSDRISKLEFGQVLSNLQSGGEIGKRGEIFVVAQFALVLFIVFGGVPFVGEPLMAVTGPLVFMGGLAVIGLSLVDLGTDSLTPFLPPTESGTLKTNGIYGQVRHPLYAGLVTTMAGLSLITNSADRFLLTVVLYALINTKASIEEDYLLKEFPDYSDYMEKVPGKFVPAVLLAGLEQLGKHE